MCIYIWGQGTFKRLVLVKSLVIFQVGVFFFFFNWGRSPNEGKYTNLYAVLNFTENEMQLGEVVQMCLILSPSIPFAKGKMLLTVISIQGIMPLPLPFPIPSNLSYSIISKSQFSISLWLGAFLLKFQYKNIP